MIDDASLSGTTPAGAVNVLSPLVQDGAAFTGTVKANGVAATTAQGTMTFKTNNVTQSVGGVISGTAESAPAIVPASYTLTAIYSGDATHMGSTATLVVSGGGSYFGTEPGHVSLSGGVATVTLSGIAGYKYSVQRATNVLFTQGLKSFPTVTAPAGGLVAVVDDFSDLGAAPSGAFYRLQYIP